MYWQRQWLRQASTFTRNSTWREDLPSNGLLGSLMFHINGPGVTDSMVAIDKWRMIDFLSKIEIVANGSQIIKSLRPDMQHVLAWLDGAGASPDQHFNYGSSTKRCHLLLNFGRRLFDTEYGLDLSRFENVEIKFTNDATSTYFGSDLAINVLCYMLRDAAPGAFRGYLKTEEWRVWQTVSAEKVYLELPTEDRIRRLLIQVIPDLDANYAAEATPYNVLYDIELKLNSGVLEVWKGNLRDLWYENYYQVGRDVIQALHPYHTDAYGIWTGFGQSLGYAGLRLNHSGAQSSYGTTLTPGDDSSTLRREAATETDQDALLVMGLALENCAWFPFNIPDVPDSYLDPARNKTVQLNCETRSGAAYADGTIRVVLDRLVT